MLFDTLALISLLVNIILLRSLVNIFPSLMACMIRWRENINLEMSAKLHRDRDKLAYAMVIPFCLVVCRTEFYRPGFMSGLSENAIIGATTGIFFLYFLSRTLIKISVRPRKLSATIYETASAANRTFFIILTLLMLAVSGVMSFMNAEIESIKTAMIWISGVTYTIFLLRKIQIFASSYNFIAVFLYLCALEIIPTGAVVASVVIF